MTTTGAPWRTLLVRAVAVGVAAIAAWLLVDRAIDGLRVVGQIDQRPLADAGPTWPLVVAAVVLVGVGALPAWRLVGRRLLAAFLAPLIGALLAAVSAMVTVVVASEPLRWFAAFAAAVNAAAVAAGATRRERGSSPGRPVGQRLAGLLFPGLLGAVVAAEASVLGRLPPPSGTTGWLRLARALGHGHRAVEPLLHLPQAASRLLASPLAAGCSAVGWLVTGHRSAALAASLLTLVSAAAVGAGACSVVEVARHLAHQASVRSGLVWVAGWLAAAAWAAGASATGDGLATGPALTVLWAASVAAAALLVAVLPPAGWPLRAGLVLVFVAAWTAPQGTAAAAVLAVVVWLRRAMGAQRSASAAGAPPVPAGSTSSSPAVGGRRPGLVGRAVDTGGLVAVLAAVAAWPVLSAVVSVGPFSPGLPPPGLVSRLADTWRVLGGRLVPAGVALGVVLVGTLVLARRRGLGLGSDAGLVALGATSLVVLLVARGWDVPAVSPLLQAPAADGAVLPLLLAAGAMAVWVLVGAAVGTGSPLRRPGTGGPHRPAESEPGSLPVPDPPASAVSPDAGAGPAELGPAELGPAGLGPTERGPAGPVPQVDEPDPTRRHSSP